MNERQRAELAVNAQREIWRRETIEGNFKSYCLYWDAPFFTERMSVLDILADAFQYVYDSYKSGKRVRVAISTPPRAGKSYISSLFISFMLGHFPTESVMRNTCTSELHMKFTKDLGKILSSRKWKECFGNISLSVNNAKQVSLETAKQISYFGAGVGGTIIGFGASMLAMTDDIFNKMEDALSGVKNESIKSWDESAMGSRLEGNCCRVDIGTRWTKDDMIGSNLDKYDRIISIPALDENGKSFCDAVHTSEYYINLRDNEVSKLTWNAEYMQQPIDIEGQLFKSDELQYSDLMPSRFESNIAVCDTADTGTDYLSSPMVKKVENLYYLYDVVFTQLNMELSAPMIEGAYIENKVQLARFESNNGGKIFARDIEKKIPSCAFYWKQTTSNKETRILTDSFWIKKHVVFRYPYDKDKHPYGYKAGSDYAVFMNQLTSYIKGKKDQHDDAADSMSMLRRLIFELGYEERKPDPKEEWPSIEIKAEQIIL